MMVSPEDAVSTDVAVTASWWPYNLAHRASNVIAVNNVHTACCGSISGLDDFGAGGRHIAGKAVYQVTTDTGESHCCHEADILYVKDLQIWHHLQLKHPQQQYQ